LFRVFFKQYYIVRRRKGIRKTMQARRKNIPPINAGISPLLRLDQINPRAEMMNSIHPEITNWRSVKCIVILSICVLPDFCS